MKQQTAQIYFTSELVPKSEPIDVSAVEPKNHQFRKCNFEKLESDFTAISSFVFFIYSCLLSSSTPFFLLLALPHSVFLFPDLKLLSISSIGMSYLATRSRYLFPNSSTSSKITSSFSSSISCPWFFKSLISSKCFSQKQPPEDVSYNSQENTCARVPFSIKLLASGKETLFPLPLSS